MGSGQHWWAVGLDWLDLSDPMILTSWQESLAVLPSILALVNHTEINISGKTAAVRWQALRPHVTQLYGHVC